MGWIKSTNVAMYGGANWDNLIKTVPNCTPEKVKRIAFKNPNITFFFLCRQYIVINNQGQLRMFNPGDAVFFSGIPWYGVAPQCDAYNKNHMTVAYTTPDDSQQFLNIGSYTLADGSPAVDVVCIFAVFTFVFIFWSIYLLENVIKRRVCYKSTMKRIHESNDQFQQEVNYLAETEYVKSIFLFSINIVEWFAVTFATTAIAYLNVSIFVICDRKIPTYISESKSMRANNHSIDCIESPSSTFQVNSQIYINMYHLRHDMFFLSLTLVACLCNYLTARYARKSWIKHNKIPYFIVLTILFLILTHLSTLVCILALIMKFLYWIVSMMLLVLGIQQYRRLRMVINWTIVDLQISQNNRRLLNKFKRENKQLRILFLILWLGAFFLLVSLLIDDIEIWTQILLLVNSNDNFNYYSLCRLQKSYIPSYILTCFATLEYFCTVMGFALIFIPYIISGFYTMSVFIWLRIQGKTGYVTHFPNPLRKPLIS